MQSFTQMDAPELAAYIAARFPNMLTRGGTPNQLHRFNRLLKVLARKTGDTVEGAADRCRAMLD